MAVRKFNKVCVIGVGLIGGSLALDAKDLGLFGHVIGCGRSVDNLETAVERGIIDDYAVKPDEAVRGAELVVLSVPVAALVNIANLIAGDLKKGALVTDVGSVKGALVGQLEEALGPKARYVGSHPIAGTENSGAASAVRNLFRGKPCILTPTEKTDSKALASVKRLWELVGMNVEKMDPHRHDMLLAATSHLPHFLAFSLAETISRFGKKESRVRDFSGGSLRDVTRVAGSSPEMWRDIFRLNSVALLEMLDLFERVGEELKEMIVERDGKRLYNFLKRVSREKKLADKR